MNRERSNGSVSHDVTIIGGGLAGMAAALRLLERGFSVQIFESTDRLGGKAGADKFGDDWDEHGWHLFPLWYLNIFEIAKELSFIENFIDKTKYGYMQSDKFPMTKYLENPFSWQLAIRNLFNGIIPPTHSYLYQFAFIDLMSHSYSSRRQLDQIALNGFVRSKWYCTEKVVKQLEDTVSRASAIESYEMSSMTVRNVMRYWFDYSSPWFRILNTDLQQGFILPIQRRLEELGCTIRFNKKVTSLDLVDKNIASVEVTDVINASSKNELVEKLLVTIAVEDIVPLLSPKILNADARLGRVFYLRSRMMAGMTIYLNNFVPDIPDYHVNFVGSPYSLSMIDVTKVWNKTDRSIICIVASDITALAGHGLQEAEIAILNDLKRYLPFLTDDNIQRINFQPHFEHPLFANTAGMWRNRPKSTTAIENLYLAGDYCRSHVDLTCMEGAVATGLLAAESIRSTKGKGEPIRVLIPTTRPRWFFVLLKALLTPCALICYLLTRVKFR